MVGKKEDKSFKETDIRPGHLQDKAQKLFESDLKRMLEYKNKFVNVKCPACNSDDTKDMFVKYEMQFVMCCKCDTVYINPRPTPEILDIYYLQSELYEFFKKHIFPFSEEVRKEKIFKPRVERLLQICKKYKVKNDLLIEVGPGFGTFSELVNKNGYFDKVIAIERTPDMAASCRERGIEVIEKPIEEVDFKDNLAQVVASFEVIEHLYYPKDFVDKCFNIIEKGGLLILTCPNSKGFDMQTLGKFSHTYDGEHLNYFTPNSLSILLEKCGFEVCEIMTPGELDAELVRQKVISNEFDIYSHPFLKQILIDKWKEVGSIFQQFLQDSKLSSHMWIVARKKDVKRK